MENDWRAKTNRRLNRDRYGGKTIRRHCRDPSLPPLMGLENQSNEVL